MTRRQSKTPIEKLARFKNSAGSQAAKDLAKKQKQEAQDKKRQARRDAKKK